MPDELPEGWEREDEELYEKFILREAVHVPKRPNGDGFHRDAVVVYTKQGRKTAGVTKGPSARRTYETPNPETVAIALAHAVQAWIDEDGDPYGGRELNERLDAAAKDASVATGVV